ncbi:MAG TPA: tRNA uridine-5-carboxymethylaminomethyl(34) synthesis enzyme MnmG, partial [Rhizobiaceae bacterium]|nr:tRNA uridine-5-carboxymethylaminomethyl(34) synthesis enzyme MnmG [Rhizobiaceae bacterium]
LNQDGIRRSGWDLLSYPEFEFETLAGLWPELQRFEPAIGAQLKIEAAYSVYLGRQSTDIAAVEREESLAIPEEFDYQALSGLSHELVQRLEKVRPASLGQAGRLEGMTPAAVTLILTHLKRNRRDARSASAGRA